MTRFSVLARSLCCSRASCHLRNDTLTGSVLHDSGAFTPIGQLTAVPYEYYDRGRVETESAHAPIITAAVLQNRRIFFWGGQGGIVPRTCPPNKFLERLSGASRMQEKNFGGRGSAPGPRLGSLQRSPRLPSWWRRGLLQRERYLKSTVSSAPDPAWVAYIAPQTL